MNGKAAVVTGASTGIGYAVVEQLSASGWQVWGGTRSDSDASKLEMSVGASSLQIEVTDEYSVKTAFDEVLASRGSSGLDLLVVNAGIVIGGPLEYVSQSAWKQQLDVNVVGAALSIRYALPLLEMCNSSRIIVVGSINSRIGLPLLSPYAASKHALVGLLSSLRQELGPQGPRITLLEPGAIRTPLWEKVEQMSHQIYEDVSPEGRRKYRPFLERALNNATRGKRGGLEAHKVAILIEKYANRRYPPRRRLVGRDARIGALLKALLPERFFDFLVRRFRSVKIST